jgi:hypothetical protein
MYKYFATFKLQANGRPYFGFESLRENPKTHKKLDISAGVSSPGCDLFFNYHHLLSPSESSLHMEHDQKLKMTSFTASAASGVVSGSS